MEQARYALICQSEGIVPIVEPDLVLAGTHTLEDAVEVRLPPHPTPWLGLGLGCGGQATPSHTDTHTPHPTPYTPQLRVRCCRDHATPSRTRTPHP